MKRPVFVLPVKSGEWRIRVWVQPRAKKTGLAGEYQEHIKIRISSPPVDDKANKELCTYLAKKLGLRSQQVTLGAGQTSRQKLLRINSNVEPDWSVLIR